MILSILPDQRCRSQPHARTGLGQERLNCGGFDQATTRVVHMVHNPETAARREAAEARFTALEAENGALRAQISRLEALPAPAAEPAAVTQRQESPPAGNAPAEGAMPLALAHAEVAVLNRKVRPDGGPASPFRDQQAKQQPTLSPHTYHVPRW